jgi:processive 1,2-diacylglycerol beta-glucosyltransferase
VVAMSGRNAQAHAALIALQRRYRERLRVCEWTDRMDMYLRACDLVVGKPGGISVAEALACGRPLLATRSLGGQEGFNVGFLDRHGVGGLVADGELSTRVESMLADRAVLEQIQQRAWRLGRRDGAARVAELALDLAAARPSLAVE